MLELNYAFHLVSSYSPRLSHYVTSLRYYHFSHSIVPSLPPCQNKYFHIELLKPNEVIKLDHFIDLAP